MTEDRAARIAQIDAEIPEVLERLDALHEEWMTAATAWLQEQFDGDVASAIKGHPEEVKALAASGALSELRSSIQEERDAIGNLVRAVFRGKAEYWSHVGGQVFESSGSGQFVPRYERGATHGGRGSKPFEDALRQLRGRVIVHLIAAGLYAEPDYVPDSSDPDGGYRYPYALAVSGDLEQRDKAYRAEYETFLQLGTEREDLAREIEEAGAEDLWKNA